jgi:hypothetical protein
MKKRFTDEQIIGFLREAEPPNWVIADWIGFYNHPRRTKLWGRRRQRWRIN